MADREYAGVLEAVIKVDKTSASASSSSGVPVSLSLVPMLEAPEFSVVLGALLVMLPPGVLRGLVATVTPRLFLASHGNPQWPTIAKVSPIIVVRLWTLTLDVLLSCHSFWSSLYT